MEGFPGIEEQDNAGVDERFQMLARILLWNGKSSISTASSPCRVDLAGLPLVADQRIDHRFGIPRRRGLFAAALQKATSAGSPDQVTVFDPPSGSSSTRKLVGSERLCEVVPFLSMRRILSSSFHEKSVTAASDLR